MSWLSRGRYDDVHWGVTKCSRSDCDLTADGWLDAVGALCALHVEEWLERTVAVEMGYRPLVAWDEEGRALREARRAAGWRS